MTVDKIIQTDSFTSFLNSARSFCRFIENDQDENYIAFLKLIQTHLQSLYFGGQNLQTVGLNHNLEFENILTETDIEKILNRLSDRLNDRFYWHVFDPADINDTEAVCGDLVDDLGDIYKDLKNSLLLFDKANPAEIETAIWTLKWGFHNHWGDHCINATYALHYFIQKTT